jgi:sigma-B regulation protein RsbQ
MKWVFAMLDLTKALNVAEWPSRADPTRSKAPAPRTLLLAHGYGCDQSMWQDLLPLLSDHHCITFNYPGAGPADPAAYDPQRHATLDGYAQSLLDLVRQLARPGLVLVGHSVSAMIGALAAVAQPQAFAELVMLCPSPSFLNDLPDYAGGFEPDQIEGLLQSLADGHAAWSQAMAPVIMANLDRPALAARLAERFCDMDPTIALRWARAAFQTDLRALLPQVQLPALVLQCRTDALAAPAVGLWTAAQLPLGRFAWLEAGGHCPQMSHPAEVARVLLAELAKPQDRLPSSPAA